MDYTFNTKTEIQQKAECETRQSECENLAKELDEVHRKISLNQSFFFKHVGTYKNAGCLYLTMKLL